MDGKKVLNWQINCNKIRDTVFAKAKVTMADIDWFISPSIKLLAMHHVRKRLDIPAEKFVDIYATHGNQMAASMPTGFKLLCAN